MSFAWFAYVNSDPLVKICMNGTYLIANLMKLYKLIMNPALITSKQLNLWNILLSIIQRPLVEHVSLLYAEMKRFFDLSCIMSVQTIICIQSLLMYFAESI